MENIRKDNGKDNKLEFYPDLPPDNIHNLKAAEAEGLLYDSDTGGYIDKDGCLIRDEYGQQL